MKHPVRVCEDQQILIEAPLVKVWSAFTRFEDWAAWANQLCQIRRHGPLLHFSSSGITPIPLYWAAQVQSPAWGHRLEFRTLSNQPHNVQMSGRVEFIPTTGGTYLRIYLEACPDFASAWMQQMAEMYIQTLAEPGKLLKLLMEQFKASLENEINLKLLPKAALLSSHAAN